MGDSSMDSIRQSAVEKAWAAERERVLNGMGTRNWSVSQQAELINTGKVTGFEGSHILSVKDYPQYAGNPENIQFLPTIAHFDGVHERNFRKDTEEGLFDERTGKIIPNQTPGQIPKQEEIKLKDRYEYSKEQADYLENLPDFDQSGQDRKDRSDASKDDVRHNREKAEYFGGDYAFETKGQTHEQYDYETNQLNPFGPQATDEEANFEPENPAPEQDGTEAMNPEPEHAASEEVAEQANLQPQEGLSPNEETDEQIGINPQPDPEYARKAAEQEEEPNYQPEENSSEQQASEEDISAAPEGQQPAENAPSETNAPDRTDEETLSR